jgi:hypothetical protein
MKDILKRDLHKGDLIVVKATARHSRGLRLGVLAHEDRLSVWFLNGIAHYTESTAFKIVNPSPEEIAVGIEINRIHTTPKLKKSDCIDGLWYKNLVTNTVFKFSGNMFYSSWDTECNWPQKTTAVHECLGEKWSKDD